MFDLLILFAFLFLLCLLFLMLKHIQRLFVVSIFAVSCEAVDLKSRPHLDQMIVIPNFFARNADHKIPTVIVKLSNTKQSSDNFGIPLSSPGHGCDFDNLPSLKKKTAKIFGNNFDTF